jgi:hypothetical protein
MSDTEIAVAEVTTPAPEAVVEMPVERSMDETLAATFEEMKARRPEHGEDGKFQAKAGAITATPELKVPGQSQTGAPDPAPLVIEAPQSLPADVKAQWATLPLEHQKWLAARESEIHKKITTDGERLKSLGAFEELSTTLQDRLREVNAPAPEYFRRLAEADRLLSRDGNAGLRQIAQMYGIDIRAAFGAGQPQGQQADPQFNALAQELSAIKSHLTAQEQAAEKAKLTEAEKKIETFKKDRPHFDKVEAQMAKLFEPGMDLDELYGMACRAHPEVSKLIQAEQDAKAKAEAIEKQKAEAAKAAKLSTQSRKPGSVGVIAKTGGSWEDSMAATFRGIRARG